MGNSLKVTLMGVILILASLFFMGICIASSPASGPEGIALALFVLGVIVSVVGIFFIRDQGLTSRTAFQR